MPLINTENSDCSGVKFEIRSAIPADRETIQHLIAISARELSRGYYSEEQVSAALKSVYGVDSMLIEDGTYFVAEANVTRARSIRISRQRRFGRFLFTRILRGKELDVRFSTGAKRKLPARDSFRWN